MPLNPHRQIPVLRESQYMNICLAAPADTKRSFLTHKSSIEALCAGYCSARDIEEWIDVLSPGIYESAIRGKGADRLECIQTHKAPG